MNFFIEKKIFEKYSNVFVGVVVIRDATVKDPIWLQDKIDTLVLQIQEDMRDKKISDLAIVKAWREAYKAFGVDPHKYTPSLEQLLKRAVQDKYPHINTLVDLYNFISIKYRIPAGGNDLDTIVGDIHLRFAEKLESSVQLIGKEEAVTPFEDEVIYADEKGTISARWNWKQDERTKITKNTKNVVFFFDAIAPTSFSLLKDALEDCVETFKIVCDGEVSFSVLDRNHRSLEIPQKGKFLAFDLKKHRDIAAEERSLEEFLPPQEYQVRKQKAETLEKLGIPAWPAHYNAMPDHASIVLSEFEQEQNTKIYTLAGRIRAIRKHGKTIFATLQDHTGFLQIYIKKDQLREQEFALFDDYLDIGDIIGVTGTSFKTKMGEITLLVTTLSLLSKAIRPLPEKFHGLTDTETIYRQRYLDVICNQDSKNRFIKRSEIIKSMRSIFDEHGYMEVETPMLHHMYGGAMAKPFVTHHNALNADLYLRIAPELYLKRLIIGGFPRVYEINRNFRNEGISTKHNPEFTMLEFYTAYMDYETTMHFTENLIRRVVDNVCGTTTVSFREYNLDFGTSFSKISMLDAVAFKTDMDLQKLLKREVLFDLAKEHGIDYTEQFSWGMLLNALFEHLVEKQLVQPTFVTQFPTDVSPLAKKNPDNSLFTDRFELFVAGMELGNGFNELNDPFDQAVRFEEQLTKHAESEEKHLFDTEYIQALEHGMPPTSGVGIGIDRLTMFLTNAPSIRDVILFPTLKRK